MKNIIKVFFGSIFPKIFIFALNVLIARSLSLNEFGFYSYVKSFYNYFETTVSSALNPFAIARLMNGDYSKAQFLGLYCIYAMISGLLAITILFFSNLSVNSTLLAVLFGGVFGSILNAYFYVILIDNQRGHIIMLSTFITAIFLLLTVLILPVSTALFAIVLALSFNVIDLVLKLIYFFRRKNMFAMKTSINFEKLPIKSSLFLMIALMLNGGVFLFQRYMLSMETDGFLQMGYLEVLMQLYALITIVLTSLANGLMREGRLKIGGFEFKGMDVLAAICAGLSLFYGGLILLFAGQISAIYKIEIPTQALNFLCLMVVMYAFAFFSVRLLILKEMQKLNLFSTIISSGLCFSVYPFMDVSVVTIIISYCLFFLFLGLINVLLFCLNQGSKV